MYRSLRHFSGSKIDGQAYAFLLHVTDVHFFNSEMYLPSAVAVFSPYWNDMEGPNDNSKSMGPKTTLCMHVLSGRSGFADNCGVGD